MKNEKQSQQGDVWLEEVDTLPKGARLVNREKKSSLILAYGEVTGHKHEIKDDLESMFYEKDGQLYLVKIGDKPLTHDTHKPIILPPRVYRFGQVFVKNYFTRIIEKIKD